MKAKTAVILAAGRGERMNSGRPAVLHPICERPVLEWVLDAARPCCEEEPILVTGSDPSVREAVGEGCRYAVQAEPNGTADALRAALRVLGDVRGAVLVLHGNIPLMQGEYLEALAGAAERDGAASLIWSDEENGEMREAGAWCLMDWALAEALDDCPEGASVSDCVERLKSRGVNVHELLTDPMLCMAATDRASLWTCDYLMNARIIAKHFHNGVTLTDPSSTRIGPDVTIGRDTVLWPNVILLGKTELGERCTIKNGCTLENTVIGDDCVLHHVTANQAKVGDRVTIGPYVNLRPGTSLADGCKVGDFVEIKNSFVGCGTKMNHFNYIGDADIGERVNVGCGAIFVNYDGVKKHRTTVGNDVFLGCQTNLIAPVTVGDGAYTAAGSTISKNVPPDAMAFARARQENKEGYAARFKALKTEK